MLRRTTYDTWLPDKPRIIDAANEFADLMRRRPFDNEEGLRGVSALALYWFIKEIQPDVVFEVGVWRGFSTWIIEQAAPHASVHCYDPLFFMEHVIDPDKVGTTYRSSSARYSRQEFSCDDIPSLIRRYKHPTVFFDDHQNKVARIRQCQAFGIHDLIFDDNTPFPTTHRTLQESLTDPGVAPGLERDIDLYEIFPALWPVDFEYQGQRILEAGFDVPVTDHLRELHSDRQWHSYVTRVRLRARSRWRLSTALRR